MAGLSGGELRLREGLLGRQRGAVGFLAEASEQVVDDRVRGLNPCGAQVAIHPRDQTGAQHGINRGSQLGAHAVLGMHALRDLMPEPGRVGTRIIQSVREFALCVRPANTRPE